MEGSAVDVNSTDLVSTRFSEFVTAAVPHFRPREHLLEAMEGFHELLYPSWLSQMSGTYSVSFMMLVALGYVLQGFHCFPWFAVG